MPASCRPLYIQLGFILQTLSSIPSLCEIRPDRSIASYRHNTNPFTYSSASIDRSEVALRLPSVLSSRDEGCAIPSAAAVGVHGIVFEPQLSSHAASRELSKNYAMRLRNLP
ncbi:uncharacterized protein K489DRAFT_125639 [Dissoconium aciculare CBS 342.82]|uniref:Uncharacterized protein n=1 Tax=Dissoconium aciculare CBS 342.82 TaxID=1314786 RepID=A0A6J3MFL7_9PEZI|nr:uncharacterized protein K489DRAFT_125639 [Dissoconium aciculare CBS 342.82]KAF1826801.1 hypothetical protein K489DRAFT_125639 [Dissoconium aciculare CBS 342.82]